MKSTKLSAAVQRILDKIAVQYPLVNQIAREIVNKNGRVLVVGGAVRDALLGKDIKDLDIEVHGIDLAMLEKILSHHGPVSLVGKAFGVLRVHGLDVDWSLPRTDTSGRKPEVTIDPHMGLLAAFARRDLTINAMGFDVATHELLDPYGGYQDLQDGVLRATDPAFFVEDPLRFYRVMQFIARFEMSPDTELNKLCSHIDLASVSVERFDAEFEKMMLKSQRPSLGIRWINEIGRLEELLPELAATKKVPQDPVWHPEGSVFEHTMQTIDAAALIAVESPDDRLKLLYSALCHDLGKITTTEFFDERLRSRGHDVEGREPTKKLLKRLTRKKWLIDAVVKLVRYHLMPIEFVTNKASFPAYKRLANKLYPDVTLWLLAQLALADKRGRNGYSSVPLAITPSEIEHFLRKAEHAKVLVNKEAPILTGKDLLPFVQPGPKMGQLLKKAYEIQIERGILDKNELIKFIMNDKESS
jgi:tRNA nucleotidyltransferase (CCA-adding enzyme)